ncbi:hypothetical protein A4A49_24548 [Nicotiana attenuata]|uniref:Uncharacterized protein n=2 Tax=Nicotiana attenuata TaxID=49451 RepID=A0A1J6KE86_NICAT|nr:hypothetical protein A4A49_24548 [Nicotiana attenuata]
MEVVEFSGVAAKRVKLLAYLIKKEGINTSKKDLSNIIEENLPQYPGVVAHVQTRSTTAAKYVVPAKQSNKEHPNIIEENMLLPKYSGVAAHVQTRSTTPATQVIDEQVEEQVQLDSTTPTVDEQSEEQGPSIQPRKRDRTKMKNVHGRQEPKVILLNHLNQPVGPSDKVVTEFGSFLGTLARNATLCPLDILDWRKMDTKEDIWEYTKDKYDIPEAGKKYTLESVQAAWKKHKSRLKKDHFYSYHNDEARLQNIPEDVPASQFKELLRYWNSEKLQVGNTCK